MATGQLFSRTTQALFYNYKQLPIQRMLDFDFLCGRETPSVAGIINPGSEGFQKLFFGQEEIAVPVHSAIEAACAAHPTADVFINFASFRSAAASSMAALKQPTIRVVAIIAEGVPESDAKQLIAYARANNKVVIGPATVGGIQAGAFKIGDTAGTIDNIIACKLYRPGSVGFVSKSTCVMKLDLSCCSDRAKKVKEKLQKLNGVYYINIDTENGLALVSGYVDPPTIQKTLGKKTEILAYEKDFIEAEKKLYQFLRKIRKEKNKKDGKVTCSCDSDFSTDDDDDGNRNPNVPFQNNGIRSGGAGWYDPRVFGGYRMPPPPRPGPAWYGNPYYANMPYGYPGINYPASYNRSPRPPPPPRPQMPLSNVCAVYGGQTEAPVGNSLYHTFSDDNVRACNVM